MAGCEYKYTRHSEAFGDAPLCARAEGGHVVLRSVAKQGHVMLCFTRRRRARVTWYSDSQAKQGHVGSDIRECKEAENGVRSTANQKMIPPQ
ncbi:hypothetical protein chiPu_0008989 [Chiloscyllium punctatum]|uniref:Uncharacterized protein n=1 Tax=Chiloscyllium punctatum TaxID=137246 RepID=A0A401SJG8_CHIPU|nr:hypothetical protein [Chiloscyllium punctatum]